MKFSKRLLSLFLAVVMVLSVFTVMASAYTMGPAVAENVNFKYTVEKVSTVPATAAGSYEYTAENIYAVSVWMQSDYAVEILTAPFHFNKAHFAPIMLVDDMGLTYPTGAGFGVDDYYTNMSEGTVYAYSEGDYLNNTGMYKADGSVASTKALAKCIGLGNSNSEGVTIIAELVSPDHPLYSSWGVGLAADTGVMYVNLDVVAKPKTAYLNTVSGITQSTAWNKMFTFYFETLPGVTDADVVGDEFGVSTADCYTVDASCDKNAGYFVSATARVSYNPVKNVVENAVITKWSPAITKLGSQIRFNSTESAGAGSANFDIRTRAQVSKADLAKVLGCDVADLTASLKAADIRMGFVYQPSTGSFDLATAKAAAEAGTSQNGYTVKDVKYLGESGDNMVWTCLVTSCAYEGEMTALPYIIYGGEAYFLDTPITCDFSVGYDAKYPSYAA